MDNKKAYLAISIDPGKDYVCIDSLLDTIFWKEPQMIGPARDFLSHVREWGMTSSPFLASDWKKYCNRSGLTQSQYHNMLKRLKKAGMVKKTYNRARKAHELRLSPDYSGMMADMKRSWDEFMRG